MIVLAINHIAASDAGVDHAATLSVNSVPIGRREWLTALAFALVLLWINAYICRDLFRNPTAYMNSMHGFWIALAKHAGNSWFKANWWPYWDCGIPFEAAYAPLVPGATAAWTALTGASPFLTFQYVTGVLYCLGPLTLFAMVWLLMRTPGYAFAAALLYSLTAPTQLIVPDGAFSWTSFWDARRLFLMTVWDDTPHLAALALLPIAILSLVRSLQRRRLRYYISAILSIALMALASEFGAIEIILAAFCLLFVFQRETLRRNIAITAALGAGAYALVLPFLSPSLIGAIAQESGNGHSPIFTLGSLTALGIVAVGWAILFQYLPRWTGDWRLQFFAYFAYLTASIPVIAAYLHRQFLPQPDRYKVEIELALAIFLVFGLRPWFERATLPLKAALIFLLLALAGEQIASHRHFARAIHAPKDVTKTIEYRTAVRAQLIGTRVMLPGSIAQWANAFSDVKQFSGSSWSKAMNPVQQLGVAAIYNGASTPEQDARISLLWLKAFGVGAIAVDGPSSQEFWKPYTHPSKFEGVLPVLWRMDDVTMYSVPERAASLAHVVPESAIVMHAPANVGDVAGMKSYVSALEDSSLPLAEMRWDGLNRVHVRTTAVPGQAISIQITYHPGWHALSVGHVISLHADGLGLMWLDPKCNGPCEVELNYDGGWELRLSRFVSFAAIATLILLPLGLAIRRRYGA
jgi:hypothetical protein